MGNTKIKITYWSDYACPYCYIGEKRLETVISELGIKNDTEVEMKAFELDADASYEVKSRTDERFALKYGLSLEGARRQIEHISQLGKAEGLDFKYIDTQYTNMLDAHRLTKLVASKGIKENTDKVIKLLFDAYFAKNLKLSDRTVLADIANQVDISTEELNSMLNSNDFIDDVRLDEKEAYKLGINGVPYFIINDSYIISGAQSKEGIKNVILQAQKQTNEIETKGMTCGPEGCI